MKISNWMQCLLFVLCLFFLSETECIINGDPVTNINDFKYTAGLEVQFGNGKSGYCGGAIIGDFTILTAAHCLVYKRSKEIVEKVKIRLRTLKNKDSVDHWKRKATKVFIPARYIRGSNENDIAIIKVDRSMNSRKLQKLELPKKNLRTDGDKAIVAGYGVFAFHENEALSTSDLTSLDVKVLRNYQCYGSKPDTYICGKPTQNEFAQGTCEGDSGSPLVETIDGKLTAIGVTQGGEIGFDCDQRRGGGYFTRVSSYLDFISKAMSDTVDDTIVSKELTNTQSCFR